MTSSKKQSGGQKLGFESSLTQIESVIDTLEHEKTSLEESLSAFETGIKLARNAQKALSSAEQKVQTLLNTNGKPSAQVFSEEDEDQ